MLPWPVTAPPITTQPRDALRQRRIELQRQREVGQRPERDQQQPAGVRVRQAQDRQRRVLGFARRAAAAHSRCRRSRRGRARSAASGAACSSGVAQPAYTGTSSRRSTSHSFSALATVCVEADVAGGDGQRRRTSCRGSLNAISSASASSTPGSVSISRGILSWSFGICGSRIGKALRSHRGAADTQPHADAYRAAPPTQRATSALGDVGRLARAAVGRRAAPPAAGRRRARGRRRGSAARPVWRVPSSSPGPRSSRSFSAMTKPSLVSRIVSSRCARHRRQRRLVQQHAARRRAAAPDAAAQLVQLRQAEALGVLDRPSGSRSARRRRPRSPWSRPAGRCRPSLNARIAACLSVGLHAAVHAADAQSGQRRRQLLERALRGLRDRPRRCRRSACTPSTPGGLRRRRRGCARSLRRGARALSATVCTGVRPGGSSSITETSRSA